MSQGETSPLGMQHFTRTCERRDHITFEPDQRRLSGESARLCSDFLIAQDLLGAVDFFA